MCPTCKVHVHHVHVICRVMMLGPPLSGKTSHCQALSGSLGLPLVQVGPLLQARASAGDTLLQEALQGTGLVPDSVYLDAVAQRIQEQDCVESGWLLDGFPHTAAQVQHCGLPVCLRPCPDSCRLCAVQPALEGSLPGSCQVYTWCKHLCTSAYSCISHLFTNGICMSAAHLVQHVDQCSICIGLTHLYGMHVKP